MAQRFFDRFDGSIHEQTWLIFRGAAWADDLQDHFYTTNFKELEGGKLHYKFMGVMTGVYATYKDGTVPVYRSVEHPASGQGL